MHPILIQFSDDFFVGTYGVMIALGLLAASTLAAWRAKRRGMNGEFFYDLTFIAVVSGFLGARILYVFTEFGEFLADPMALILSRTGFVFLGGLIAAIGACLWYVRLKRVDVWKAADIAGPSIAIGHAFGRIGCHLAGCCFGGQCPAPMGIHVPRVEMPGGGLWENAYADHLRRHLIESTELHSLAIWPVQLMESAALFLLAGALLFAGNRLLPKGIIFGWYLAGYAVIRFVLEFLRGDEARGVYFGGLASTSQLISVGLLGAGVWVILVSRKHERWAPLPAGQEPPEPPAGEPESGKSRLRERRERRKAGRDT